MPQTWILTGSPENYAATRSRDFSVIGLKERNRNRALEIESGDRIVLYLTRVKAFAASIRVEGELYEDATKVWPGKPGKVDSYPWRFPTSPELVLDEANWVAAEQLADELEHVAKWPREHWTLAFQGQIRAVSEHDADALLARMTAAAAAGPGAAAGPARRSGGLGRARMSAPGSGGAAAPHRASPPARVARVWKDLPDDRRLAVGAALGLVVTLFLPWYQETVIASGPSALRSASASLTGWGAFSFVEAAVLLVAAGVLVLLFIRAEGGVFHIPGGDGGVITAAGVWTCVLILWRMFDKEGTSVHGQYTTTSGIEWGIFVALAVAGLLTYAGTRIRIAHQPEPPLPGEPGAADARRRERGRRRRGGAQPPDAAPAPRRVPRAPEMEADETWVQHPDAPAEATPGAPRRKRAAASPRSGSDSRLDVHEIHELDIAEPPTSPLGHFEPPTEPTVPDEPPTEPTVPDEPPTNSTARTERAPRTERAARTERTPRLDDRD